MGMNTNTITLSIAGQSWVATYAGPHAAKIVRLFGAPTLPMPWAADADAQRVLADTIARNPAASVQFAQEAR